MSQRHSRRNRKRREARISPDTDMGSGGIASFGVPDPWQEQHEPTEAVSVTIANAVRLGPDGRTVRIVRTRQVCRRRRDDARLFDSLDERQQRAFEQIAAAFRASTGGIGWKIRNLEAIGKSASTYTEYQLDLRNRYRAWAEACQNYNLHAGMAIDIIAFGLSCRAVDSERRVRKGTARLNLAECLDLWK